MTLEAVGQPEHGLRLAPRPWAARENPGTENARGRGALAGLGEFDEAEAERLHEALVVAHLARVHHALELQLAGEVARRGAPAGIVGVLDLPAHDATVAAQLKVIEDMIRFARELDRELARCLRELARCLRDRDRKQAGADEVLELVAAVGAPEAARFGQCRIRHVA